MADWNYYLTSEYKDHRELKLEDGELMIKDDYLEYCSDKEIDEEVFIYDENNEKIPNKKDGFIFLTVRRLIENITSDKSPIAFLEEKEIKYNKPSEILEELKTDKVIINTFKNGEIYDWFLSFVEIHKECDVIKLDSYRWGDCVSDKDETDVLEYFLNANN
jgi:hypothetical protein